MGQPLLTIAIPTYQRAHLLAGCLKAVLGQITAFKLTEVEVVVFDNASSDDTEQTVKALIDEGHQIEYHRNETNIGADGNISACFKKARGKYAWVLSDDDILMPGYLPKLVELLGNGNYGAVFLSPIWFTDKLDMPPVFEGQLSTTVYNDPFLYAQRVNYWATFISGNIINRSLFLDIGYIEEYQGTLLVQLSWTLPAMFKGRPNVFVNDKVLACRADNTGGYQLLKVFGHNFNKEMDKLIGDGLIDKRVKRMMNNHLLNFFFPMFIKRPGKNFGSESRFKIMLPVFWSYRSFWTKIFPLLFKTKFSGHAGV